MKTVVRTGLVLCCALVLITGACSKKDAASGGTAAGEEKKVELRLAGGIPKSTHVGAEKFKEVVERETDGSVIINIYHDGVIGVDRVVYEEMIFGEIDIALSSSSPIAPMYADFYLFDAPFIFMDTQDAWANLDGVGRKILDGMTTIGLKGLCLWENGFRHYTNNKVPMNKPADVKGIKLRVMENDIHIAAWKAYGANPTPMAFQELFTALQQGTVDAQENPLSNIDTGKFYEICKYISMTGHVYTPYVLAMNLDKFNSLSPRQQAAILKAADECTVAQREASQRFEKDILDMLVANGNVIVNLTKDEKLVFQNLSNEAKIYDMVKARMEHPEYLDEILVHNK